MLAAWPRAASAAWPWIRRCPPRSRTKFSTPIPTPISTMLRSKSGAPAPWRCAACCPKRWPRRSGGSIPAAIAEVRADAWPDVRDADELHDALLTLVALPELDRCRRQRTAAPARCGARSAIHSRMARLLRRIGCASTAPRAPQWNGARIGCAPSEPKLSPDFRCGACFADVLPEVGEAASSREDALLRSGHRLDGARRPHDRAASLSARARRCRRPEIDKALLRLEASGTFCAANSQTPRAKRTPKRMVRTPPAGAHSPAHARRIAQADSAGHAGAIHALAAALAARRARHATAGERGMLEVLRQLQGFEAPRTPGSGRFSQRRVAGYAPEMLDQLCLTGAVGWGRLSPHPGRRSEALARAAATPRDPHQRRAHRLFRARRCRLDDVAASRMTPTAHAERPEPRGARSPRIPAAARRFVLSPTSCAAPAS